MVRGPNILCCRRCCRCAMATKDDCKGLRTADAKEMVADIPILVCFILLGLTPAIEKKQQQGHCGI